MSLQLANVDQGLTNVAASVLTAQAAGALTILKATVANTDAAAHKVTLCRVPAGGNAIPANELVSGQVVNGGETVILPISGHNLVNGQSLQAFAEVAGEVNISVSYAAST